MDKQKNIFKRFYKHVLAFAIILALGNYLIGFSVDKQKKQYLDMQTELLSTKYKTNYKYFKIMSKDIYSMYQDNSHVVNAIDQALSADDVQKDKLRKELFAKLNKRYKRLKNMGVMQLHFHLPDNTSFLRMHKPEKFGDDLSKYRKSVALANKTKTFQEGFEVGRVIHGFRFVYPLFKGDKHIGSMEASFSSTKLTSAILDSYIIDSHFLISKTEIDRIIWPELKDLLYEKSYESPDFLLESSTHRDPQSAHIEKNIIDKYLYNDISKRMLRGDPFSVSNSYNYDSIVGVFIPVKNLGNEETIAYLATYMESDYIDNLLLEEQYMRLLFDSILLLLLMFSIYVSINRDKLHTMAHYDKLTDLPNRAHFYIAFEHELNRAKRHKNKLAVMFIDLDGFKAVNDTYGHNIGDELLIEVSKRLKNSVRASDIIARLGGDEFTAVLTNIETDDDALKVANKIINILGANFVINKKLINIGASIGIATFPRCGTDSDTLIRNSDTAMYKAKESGKNCAIVHQEN